MHVAGAPRPPRMSTDVVPESFLQWFVGLVTKGLTELRRVLLGTETLSLVSKEITYIYPTPCTMWSEGF